MRLALPIEAPSYTQAVWSHDRVEYYLRTDNEYLFRKLHYRVNGALLDQVSGHQVDSTTEKLVIAIHGWNRTGQSDQFSSGSLATLSAEITSRLAATDWRYVQYHWERDAETGNLDLASSGLASPYINATEAAEIAYTHGLHLGELLLAGCPNLRSVHFVAHSAGSWVAHAAAKSLLKYRSDLRIQVTLLDPFVPGSEDWPEIPDSRLDRIEMAFTLGLLAKDSPDALWLFENYYAIDAIDQVYTFLPTAQTFDTVFTANLNRRIDYDGNYASHSGPVEWYKDTVIDPYTDPEGLSSNPGRGWLNSMFMNEPIFEGPPLEAQSDNLIQGESLSLSVTAKTRRGSMTAQVQWQWFKNGVALPDQTASTLFIATVDQSDQGDYSVAVTYNRLTSYSGTAFISVAGAGPYITAHPLSTTVAPAHDAFFSVQVGGAPPLAYQWMLNGIDIQGSDGDTLIIPSVAIDDSGNEYSVRVSNAGGEVVSEPAILIVTDKPPVDIYEPNDTSLTATPMGLNDTRVAYIGSPSDVDWFAVNVTEAGALAINLSVPSGLDYDLELYGPNALYKAGSYGVVGEDESITYNITTLGTYVFRVYGWPVGDGSWSTVAPYTITTAFTQNDIVISAQPLDVAVPWGAAATFSVTATSSIDGALTYQWRRNGIDIPGASGSSYTTYETQLANDGDAYDVVVSNTFGNYVSMSANLTVTDPPAIKWTGAVSDDWHESGNWDLNRIPTSSDIVRIAIGAPRLTSNVARGTVIVDVPFTWVGGEIDATLTVAAGAELHISGSATKTLKGILRNFGIVRLTGTGMLDGRGGIIENNAGGLIDIRDDLSITSPGHPRLTIHNAGVLRKSEGAGTCVIGISGDFTNSGSIEVLSGTLRTHRGIVGTGLVQVGSGATLIHSGGSSEYRDGSGLDVAAGGSVEFTGGTHTFEAGSTVTGDGTFRAAGHAALGGSLPRLILDDGAVTLSGTFTITDSMEWSAGELLATLTVAAGAELHISGSATKTLKGILRNFGIVRLTGTGMLDGRGGIIENNAGGLIDIRDDLSITSPGHPRLTIHNAGVLRKSEGAGTCVIGISGDFTNSGSIEVLSGTLQIHRGIDGTGSLHVASACVYSSAQPLAITQGVLSGAGFIDADVDNMGTVHLDSSAGHLTIQGNYTQGPDSVLEVEIGGDSLGTSSGQLVVTGNVSLDGQVAIQLIDSYAPSTGQTFTVVSCGGTLSGEFSEVAGAHISRDVVFAPEYQLSAVSFVTRASRPYEQWAWDRFGDQVNDPAISGYAQDPDKDGVINILEYAFARNPLLPDNGHLLLVDTLEIDSKKYLSITFSRPINADDIIYIPRVSSDLRDLWDSDENATLIHQVIDGGTTETVTIRDTTPLCEASARFMTIGVRMIEGLVE